MRHVLHAAFPIRHSPPRHLQSSCNTPSSLSASHTLSLCSLTPPAPLSSLSLALSVLPLCLLISAHALNTYRLYDLSYFPFPEKIGMDCMPCASIFKNSTWCRLPLRSGVSSQQRRAAAVLADVQVASCLAVAGDGRDGKRQDEAAVVVLAEGLE